MARDKSNDLSATPEDGDDAQEQSIQHGITVTSEWEGPLPPPAAIRAFEEVAPGSAQLILREFEKEADHRRSQERREATFRINESHIGQASALIFGLTALGVAAFAAYEHAAWIGSVVGGGAIASGIIALRGRQKSKD